MAILQLKKLHLDPVLSYPSIKFRKRDWASSIQSKYFEEGKRFVLSVCACLGEKVQSKIKSQSRSIWYSSPRDMCDTDKLLFIDRNSSLAATDN